MKLIRKLASEVGALIKRRLQRLIDDEPAELLLFAAGQLDERPQWQRETQIDGHLAAGFYLDL